MEVEDEIKKLSVAKTLTHCEYYVWSEHKHFPKESERLGTNCRCNAKRPVICKRPRACSAPGSSYQVNGQTGDHFKFGSQGLKGPVSAILCDEHREKLAEQGFEVVAETMRRDPA